MKTHINKFKIGIALLSFFSIFAIPFIIWNITFGFIVSLFLTIVFIGGWYYFLKKRKLKIIFWAIIIGFILYIIFLPLTSSHLNKKQKEYYSKIQSGKELNTKEMWNLYGFHITVIIAGIPTAPQASLEIFLMHFPTKDKHRTFHSDFFLDSPKLRRELAEKDSGVFNWRRVDFMVITPEHKVSSALNPAIYKVYRSKHKIEYNVTAPVFWHTATVTLVPWPIRLEINESLFQYLEKRNWLYGYYATWKYTKLNV